MEIGRLSEGPGSLPHSMHMMRNISHGFPQQNIIVTVYHNMHHLQQHLTQPQIPYILFTSTNEYFNQSNEQEKYLAFYGHREPGLLETGTRAVKEWAWELKSEPFVTPLANRNSRTLTERPPLSRTGYKDVSGNEGLSATFWSRWII